MNSFDEAFEKFKNVPLTESGLSRLFKHNTEHDCGIMTAFRLAPDCGKGKPYTTKEKRQRNKSLRGKLLVQNYGVTSVVGKYQEGGIDVKEEGYFVVDLNDTGQLEAVLRKLGEYFEQDSVLIIPKGAIDGGEAQAFLVGTNDCDDNDLQNGQKDYFSKSKFGHAGEMYATYVHGRPFVFESAGKKLTRPQNGMGLWAQSRIAKKEWYDIEEKD